MAKKSEDDTKDILVDYIPMDVRSVSEYQYDEKMFAYGIDTGSYLAGIGTALKNMNADIEVDDIIEILKCVIESKYGLDKKSE